MQKLIENTSTLELNQEHVKIQNELKKLGVTQQQINRLCVLERELMDRETSG